jgi:hypothetical protein
MYQILHGREAEGREKAGAWRLVSSNTTRHPYRSCLNKSVKLEVRRAVRVTLKVEYIAWCLPHRKAFSVFLLTHARTSTHTKYRKNASRKQKADAAKAAPTGAKTKSPEVRSLGDADSMPR